MVCIHLKPPEASTLRMNGGPLVGYAFRHVKPRCGFGSANTFVANNPSQLDAFFSYAKGMIVQQYLEVEVTL